MRRVVLRHRVSYLHEVVGLVDMEGRDWFDPFDGLLDSEIREKAFEESVTSVAFVERLAGEQIEAGSLLAAEQLVE